MSALCSQSCMLHDIPKIFNASAWDFFSEQHFFAILFLQELIEMIFETLFCYSEHLSKLNMEILPLSYRTSDSVRNFIFTTF